MGAVRSGGHGGGAVDPSVARALVVAMAVVVAATVVGVAVLWPRGEADVDSRLLGTPTDLVDGTVVGRRTTACAGSDPRAGILCDQLEVRLEEGLDEGETTSIEFSPSPGNPAIEPGARLVLGYTADAPEGLQYYFADFQRETPLLWLGLLFAVVVVALGRRLGLRALAGTGLSLCVLVGFVLPALLVGRDPLAVAIVGSAVIMLVALYLTHGVTALTTTAALGTLASLTITGVLAVVFVGATNLTGLSSEEAVYVKVLSERIDVRGLLLGGIVIGALGVLDDVTVTQASSVWELHHANPDYGPGALYRSALRIGRDHIASTVNTLVLAYAGASLPLLVLFRQSDRPLGDVLTGEVVAVEVVRTLVGSIGLVASVPITTALAAFVVTRSTAGPAAPPAAADAVG